MSLEVIAPTWECVVVRIEVGVLPHAWSSAKQRADLSAQQVRCIELICRCACGANANSALAQGNWRGVQEYRDAGNFGVGCQYLITCVACICTIAPAVDQH